MPAVHTLGAHYLNADTSMFMQLVEGDLFARFPTLRWPSRTAAARPPVTGGRFRGLADRLGLPQLSEHVMGNVFFDTRMHHQAGIDLLVRVIDVRNVVFASEMIGAVCGVDPETGHHWDGTKRYIEAADLPDEDRRAILEANALRIYPRLAWHAV